MKHPIPAYRGHCIPVSGCRNAVPILDISVTATDSRFQECDGTTGPLSLDQPHLRFQEQLPLLPIRQKSGKLPVKMRRMIRLQKMREFVVHHVFNAGKRCADQRVIEGQDTPFRLTASPPGYHPTETYFREPDSVGIEPGIHLPADGQNDLFTPVLKPGGQNSSPFFKVVRVRNGKRNHAPVRSDVCLPF